MTAFSITKDTPPTRWFYQGMLVQSNYIPSESHEGFVYVVIHKPTKKQYIGIKKFWNMIRRKPLKGKKRVRVDRVESDWRRYKTSSPLIQQDLLDNPHQYDCVMLRLCETVIELKVYETYFQLQYYVDGEWDLLLNEVINLRLRIRK